MQTSINDTSNQEILEAVNKFANSVAKEFIEVRQDISTLKSDVTTLSTDVTSLKTDVKWIKSNMVTKDDLVKEHAILKGDIILTMRKEDKKLGELVGILHEKNVIDDADVKRVVSMEPFAQLSV